MMLFTSPGQSRQLHFYLRHWRRAIKAAGLRRKGRSIGGEPNICDTKLRGLWPFAGFLLSARTT